jgi:hypothetical protein
LDFKSEFIDEEKEKEGWKNEKKKSKTRQKSKKIDS